MNITPADPTGGVSEVRESLFRNVIPEFLMKNERMLMGVAAGTVTGAIVGYYIESTTYDDSSLVKHLRDDPNYATDTSWKALKLGALGAFFGTLVVGLVGYGATTLADQDDRVAGTIGPNSKWSTNPSGPSAADCQQLMSRNPGYQGDCAVLEVDLVRIDPLDFVRLGKRAQDLHNVENSGGRKYPYEWISGLGEGSTGPNYNGVVRVESEQFEAASNGAHVETGFLYYGLCTYTQAIPWGSPDAHEYCFGPRSPLSMRQRSTIASTVGTADLRRPQAWSTLSRACSLRSSPPACCGRRAPNRQWSGSSRSGSHQCRKRAARPGSHALDANQRAARERLDAKDAAHQSTRDARGGYSATLMSKVHGEGGAKRPEYNRMSKTNRCLESRKVLKQCHPSIAIRGVRNCAAL